MVGERKRLAILFISLLLIIVAGHELLNNKCDFSLKHQILTCVDLNLKDSELGSLVKEDTHVLTIKGSSNLDIPSHYHTDGNFRHITSYRLAENGIVNIHSFAFNEMKNLRYLTITNNQDWSTVESNTFSGLNELEILNLANNSIRRLEDDAFEGLSGVTGLELTRNKFQVLPSSIFRPLRSVTSLFLYYNSIEILEDGCFDGLAELQLLDLTHNSIKTIKTSEFNRLTKLTDLYLSFNEIEVIQGKFAVSNLKFLYLQHNKLTSISDVVFNSSPNLVAIDVSYNEISSVADDAFSELTRLDHVNLGHNRVTSFTNLKFSDINKPLVID